VVAWFLCRVAAPVLFGGLALAGCEPPPPPPPPVEPVQARPEFIIYKAGIQSIEIVVFESFPVQVRVIVTGWLPDGCTRVKSIDEVREGNVFHVTILTIRPADAMCTMAVVKLQEAFPLDVEGLEAGLYTVDVNGNSKTFRLRTDNTAR
jgi:inhibitor of cysteine peptidase